MTEHTDVVIIGAGLSGIGAACILAQECPDREVVLLEGRDALGGTWDLFRYPGVRSDSDMFTLGYSFKPWTDAKAIADGGSILSYITEAAREFGIEKKIRYGHKVVSASWSSQDARWTVLVDHDGSQTELTCSFLHVCAGYYRYDEGYTPSFPGRADFAGQIVHPQFWPADLDYAGKQVVIIGSGATAVTLVPSLAPDVARVTMLQRSPTYIGSVPSQDKIADWLRRRLPQRLSYRIVRAKNILYSVGIYQLSRRRPKVLKDALRKAAVARLPEGFDVDTHFSPTYDPWDQRLCAAPDGDFFRAIRSGKAEVVTAAIDRFTAEGVLLTDGRLLPADIIVTATGLNLNPAGGIPLSVDDVPVEVGESYVYKGMMLSGVPNMALTMGYINASWTLKADLVAHYVARVLNHMERNHYDVIVPERPDADSDVPMIEMTSGYFRRGIDLLPRQGARNPWKVHQNYLRDVRLMGRGPIDDEVRFERVRTGVAS